MMAMTTRSSTSVKARLMVGMGCLGGRVQGSGFRA
jgi:hypothetical protein